jgi:hypothetical protein
VQSGGPPAFMPDGGPASRPQPELPASCRMQGANPAGWVTSCCPCQ